MSRWRILTGDCRDALATLPERSVQTCVTSPPYFGLRDYGHDGQIGLEDSVDAYVAAIVDVMDGVARVLRDDGTLWLNLGDSYARAGGPGGGFAGSNLNASTKRHNLERPIADGRRRAVGLKDKDLVGVPWRVAFALQAAGWYLRSEVIWNKPNPMPESVTDRPTRSHETIFLLAKQQRYYYDAAAIREPAAYGNHRRTVTDNGRGHHGDDVPPGTGPHRGLRHAPGASAGRNKRDVWTVTTKPYAGAHFATYPPDLIEPCILAGSRARDTVLDPFSGAGTTGLVALRHDRSYLGIELNPEYAEMARWRIRDDAPLFNVPAEAAA